jgi:hypothetical protein
MISSGFWKHSYLSGQFLCLNTFLKLKNLWRGSLGFPGRKGKIYREKTWRNWVQPGNEKDVTSSETEECRKQWMKEIETIEERIWRILQLALNLSVKQTEDEFLRARGRGDQAVSCKNRKQAFNNQCRKLISEPPKD